MIQTVFVEIENHPVGVVVDEREGWRFYGASQIFEVIDGKLFPSIDAAQTAAVGVLASSEGRRPPRRSGPRFGDG
jgi:hypothetical protein